MCGVSSASSTAQQGSGANQASTRDQHETVDCQVLVLTYFQATRGTMTFSWGVDAALVAAPFPSGFTARDQRTQEEHKKKSDQTNQTHPA